MISRSYDPATGARISQRADTTPFTGVPSGPQPDANVPGPFSGTKGWDGYDPSSSPIDPHDALFEVGTFGTPDTGPVPDNIQGGDVGDVAAIFADNSASDFGPVPTNIVTRKHREPSDKDLGDFADVEDVPDIGEEPDDPEDDPEDNCHRGYHGAYPPGPFSRSKGR